MAFHPEEDDARMARKLKVYRTPIGFHDAYVAASSQKEALRAWGADADLFAHGIAEVVTDEELTRESLDKPGEVVRRLRGTSDEHIAALPKDTPAPRRRTETPDDDKGPTPRRRRSESGSGKPAAAKPQRKEARPAKAAAKPDSEPTPKKPARPRPSRTRLDDAEQAVEKAQADHKNRIADLQQRERDFQRERRALEAAHEKEIAKLEAALEKTRQRYGEALQKWRSA